MYNEFKNVKEWYGHTPEAFMAFLSFQRYVNGTIIQWDRIQVDKKALPGQSKEEYIKLMITLFLDVHFYFICYDKASKLLKHFVELEDETKLNCLWQKFGPKFKPFRIARNHLEHIHERVTRDYMWDFGNIKGDTYTFGGESFDIGKAGLKILTDAYEEVVDILCSRPKNKLSNS